jgi:Low affinity iron permease
VASLVAEKVIELARTGERDLRLEAKGASNIQRKKAALGPRFMNRFGAEAMSGHWPSKSAVKFKVYPDRAIRVLDILSHAEDQAILSYERFVAIHYSDTWQLVINTGTTIVTFLMVFLIQNSQNRDNAAIQVKARRTDPGQ